MKLIWVVCLVTAIAGSASLRAGEIHEAAAAGDVEKVRALLQAQPELVNARELGTTPLHEAAAKGHLKVVELLLAAGANVNTNNSSGLTPLRLALGYGHKEIADLIRRHGGLEALPRTTPSHPPAAPTRPLVPQAPLEVSPTIPAPAPPPPSTPPPSEAGRLASPRPTNEPPVVPLPVLFPIHEAAAVGDVEAVKTQLKTWPELLEAEDDARRTPLHVAAANGRKEVAEVLLARRANVAARTKVGWTPLHFAAHHGDPACVELLLAYGAAINARTVLDETPLHLAARGGHTEAARRLLERNADLTVREKAAGATPLHFAAHSGRVPLVELLLARGADVNAQDALGDSPLSVALAANHAAVAELLRRHGGRDSRNPALTPLEQSLVEYYRTVDQTFRTGSASEKRKVALGMLPTKADVQTLFPQHAAQAWKVVEQLTDQVKTALARSARDAGKEPPVTKLKTAPPSAYIQQCQARGWLAPTVPIYTLVVTRQDGRIISDAYAYVNRHWITLPPLERVFTE